MSETDRVVAELQDAAARLRSEGPPPGRAWCQAWTSVVDDALVQLSDPFLRHESFTVVAVGGYGRRELCPESDVDLLLLYDRMEKETLERAVRGIVYPLWDAGLEVGYSVRTRFDQLASIGDVDNATAILDARHLAGDAGLLARVQRESIRRLRRRSDRFLQALGRADDQRRSRAGDSAEVLEPDLKNGAGGLRDIQSLRWAAGALVGRVGLDPLVGAGYLGASDLPRLVRAEDRLIELRVALHLVAGKTDVMRFDHQEQVAKLLGLTDVDEHRLAPHELLDRHFLSARTVDHVHRRAWTLVAADAERGGRRRGRPTEQVIDGFEIVDGVLRIPDNMDPSTEDLPTRLLCALTDTGAVLDRASATRLRTHVEGGDVRWEWSARDRERFAWALWRGRLALPALAELDDVGALVALIPDWGPLRGRAQRNPFHRYALDRHALHAAAELGEIVRRERWASEALARIEDREGLLLGVLFHDVGKAHGEPHAQTGAPLARSMASRMGTTDETAAFVGKLTLLHLVIPEAARGRDINDPALAMEIAEQVGDHATLAALHLLAAADARATGPAAWNDWTASLVRSLVTKVAAVLDEKHPDEVADGAFVTARDAQEMAAELGSNAEDVRAHLAMLPTRYAAAVSARAVVRHMLMSSAAPGPTEVRTRVTPGEDDESAVDGIDELDVVAIDHPGWFAKVAGVLSLHGGSILAADAFCRQDGLAVDTFQVRRPEGATGSWWARVEGDLSDAAAGRLAVRARVRRKARGDDRRVARLPEVPTQVSAEPDVSGNSTVVEIRTLDRAGVLYAITSAMAEMEVDIVVARIQTVGHEAFDVFYCRDADGKPLDDEHLEELSLAITASIAELSADA